MNTFSHIAKIGGVYQDTAAGVDQNLSSAKDWLSGLEFPWLLIIDNADDPKISIDDYFPDNKRGLILITTRNPHLSDVGNIHERCFKFQSLPEREASVLLLKAAHEPEPWSESLHIQASRITRELGFLPLALIQAGCTLKKKLCKFGEYLGFLREEQKEIRKTGRIPGGYGHENVYSSYEVTYKRLEQSQEAECIDAVELLKLFSFFDNKEIHLDLLLLAAVNLKKMRGATEKRHKVASAETNPEDRSWVSKLRGLTLGMLAALFEDRSQPVLLIVLRQIGLSASSESFDGVCSTPTTAFDSTRFRLRMALDELTMMSLISYDEVTDMYSMHPLVHTWVRQRPSMKSAQQAIWCEAATKTLAHCIEIPGSGVNKPDENTFRCLLPHIIHVQERQEEIRSHYSSNAMQRNGLRRLFSTTSPSYSPRQIEHRAKFGIVYLQCGYFDKARINHEIVKDYLYRNLGPEHPKAIQLSLLLFGTYWKLSRGNQTAELLHQVLQTCLRRLGPDHEDTLEVMDSLGTSRRMQGQLKVAVTLHERAIEGMHRKLGENNKRTLLAMDNLGCDLWMCFRFEEARS